VGSNPTPSAHEHRVTASDLQKPVGRPVPSIVRLRPCLPEAIRGKGHAGGTRCQGAAARSHSAQLAPEVRIGRLVGPCPHEVGDLPTLLAMTSLRLRLDVVAAVLAGVGLAVALAGFVVLGTGYQDHRRVPLVSDTDPITYGDGKFTVVSLPLSVTPPATFVCRRGAGEQVCLAPTDEVSGTSLGAGAPSSPTPAAQLAQPEVAPLKGKGIVDTSAVLMAAGGTLLLGIAALLGVIHERAREKRGARRGGTRR
jgi:hypothetical protein